MKKKIKSYIHFLADEEAEQSEYETLPIILLAFPKLADMIQAKRYAHRVLDELWDEEVPDKIILSFSTLEKVKREGLTSLIWEDV